MDRIFQAATSLFAKIDHVLNRFLQELGINFEHDLLEFNYSSPQICRVLFLSIKDPKLSFDSEYCNHIFHQFVSSLPRAPSQ